MSLSPIVSVIMPVYNSERYLSQAIQSILDQTYQNFELIIIDDGSDDSSWKIVTSFQEKDSRIRGIRQLENQGVAATSNHGLDLATGKYIARMDSDDISLPNRLAKQVSFLESHLDIGIVGGRMMFMDETGKLLGAFPIIQGSLNIYWNFMFESPFNNTTVMFRKSLVERYKLRYDPSTLYGEDYDLWCRFLPVTRGENLASILLFCRLHSQSLTPQYANQQGELGVAMSAFAVQTYLPELPVSKQEIIGLQSAIKGFPSSAKRQRAKLLPVYLEIWDAFKHKHKDEDLSRLKRTVFAWAARMILYPLFQQGTVRALWLLTKAEWLWPFFLLEKIPYYWARRRF